MASRLKAAADGQPATTSRPAKSTKPPPDPSMSRTTRARAQATGEVVPSIALPTDRARKKSKAPAVDEPDESEKPVEGVHDSSGQDGGTDAQKIVEEEENETGWEDDDDQDETVGPEAQASTEPSAPKKRQDRHVKAAGLKRASRKRDAPSGPAPAPVRARTPTPAPARTPTPALARTPTPLPADDGSDVDEGEPVGRFSFTEEEEAEFELGIVDAREGDEGDGDGEHAHFKPGPMPNDELAEFNEKCRQFRAYLNARARKSKKNPTVLWRMAGLYFNILRKQTVYNLFVKRYCMLNPKKPDETKREYHSRYLDAYYDKIGDMSKEELDAFKAEMLQWDEKYEQHCARDMEEAGDAWKGVAEATKVMSSMAEQLGNKFSVAIVGFVVTTRGDARAIAMNRGFASSSTVRHFMDRRQLDMQNLMGELTLMFGADRVINGLRGDWSDKALEAVLALPAQAQRGHMLPAMLAFQNLGAEVPSGTVKWNGYADRLIGAEMTVECWPASARVPDEVGDNKYHKGEFNALYPRLCHTLSKKPGVPHLRFVPWSITQKEMKDKNRAAYLQIPLFRDEKNNIIFDVHDAITTDAVPKRAWVRKLMNKDGARSESEKEKGSGSSDASDSSSKRAARAQTSSRKASARKKKTETKSASKKTKSSNEAAVPTVTARKRTKRQREVTSGGEDTGRGQRRKRNPVGGGGHPIIDEYGYLQPFIPQRREKPDYEHVPEMRPSDGEVYSQQMQIDSWASQGISRHAHRQSTQPHPDRYSSVPPPPRDGRDDSIPPPSRHGRYESVPPPRDGRADSIPPLSRQERYESVHPPRDGRDVSIPPLSRHGRESVPPPRDVRDDSIPPPSRQGRYESAHLPRDGRDDSIPPLAPRSNSRAPYPDLYPPPPRSNSHTPRIDYREPPYTRGHSHPYQPQPGREYSNATNLIPHASGSRTRRAAPGSGYDTDSSDVEADGGTVIGGPSAFVSGTMQMYSQLPQNEQYGPYYPQQASSQQLLQLQQAQLQQAQLQQAQLQQAQLQRAQFQQAQFQQAQFQQAQFQQQQLNSPQPPMNPVLYGFGGVAQGSSPARRSVERTSGPTETFDFGRRDVRMSPVNEETALAMDL